MMTTLLLHAVFEYDLPTDNTTIPQCIYTCNLTRAHMLANATQGGGEGFEFVLQRFPPNYLY